MDPDTGSSSSGEKSSETIISITDQCTGNGYTSRLHFFCLIVTDKRIICVKTDDLIDARRKEAEEDLGTFDRSFRRFLEWVFRAPFYSIHFSDHFREMHPADIIAAHPDAEVIPLNTLISFVMKNEFHLTAFGSSANHIYLDTKITGRTKTPGRTRTIELYMGYHPENRPDIDALQSLLGDRFIPPNLMSDMISW